MGNSWVNGCARAARIATVGLVAGALMISGIGTASAEDAAPVDAPTAATEGGATPDAGASDAPASQAVSDTSSVSDPGSSAPVPTQPSAAPEQSAPQTPVETQAPVETTETPDAVAPADEQPQARSTVTSELPALRWQTIDSAGATVAGVTVALEGPRDADVEDRGDDEQWAGAPTATVEDNTGAADYTGADLDPTPGFFLVEEFADQDDSEAVAVAVVPENDYRLRPVTADGFLTGDDAAWTTLAVLTDAATDTQDVTLTAPEAAAETEARTDVSPLAVTANAPAYAPVCQAGNVYAISDSGQLQAINNGTRQNIGTSISSTSINGLGIAAEGSAVYAIRRTGSSNSQTATVYSFNTTTGVWSSTGHSHDTSVSLVAGAVNLNDGTYVFGGFASDGSQFRMWRYNPANGQFSYLGYTTTNMGNDGLNNGDIAFNAAGDMFIVHGRGNNVTVFSITAANFNAANGGQITSAKSATIRTNSSGVNGVAFDASGKAYLGSSSQIRSYDMPNWSNSQLFTNNINDSTDLASCSSPATIKLQKVVQGGRASAGDQFKLDLNQNGTLLGTATTTGSAAGVQAEVVGPLPVVRGAALTFSESFVNGASSADYATTYQCLVDGAPMSPAVTGNATNGAITIPSVGEAIVCEFVNTPLTASVSITKRVQDTNGENETTASGWIVDAVPTATAGTVSRTPNAAQQTNASGAATWPLRFGTAASRATVNVSETQQTGYEFVTGECTITPMVGEPTEVDLTGADATALTGVKPGDSVDCTYVNRQLPGSIVWEKVTDDEPAVNIGGSVWSVTGPGGYSESVEDCIGDSLAACASALDKDERAGFLKLTDLAWGEYTITETTAPEGFEPDGTAHKVTITAANAVAGAVLDPIVNVRMLGSATWSKIDAATSELLGGSEWTITGPGFTAPNNVIEDCVADNDDDCTGLDKDSRAGVLLITGLAWGDYTIVESTAPLGYILDDTEHDFTVDATTVNAVIALGSFENTAATPPALPMTGGLSADFYSFLGLGVLLLALMLLIARRVWVRRHRTDTGA